MNELTYSAAFREGVKEEMERDERIFVLGTDLAERGGHFAQVKGLAAIFGPERIRDTPISEAAMVAAGVGAALYGMRPLVDLNFIDFSFGAMDEIVNQAAKIRYMFGKSVPLVIRGTSGVGVGGAQHNNTLEMFFAQVPGLAVAVPATPFDVKGLIKSALKSADPVIFLMHKRLSGSRGPVGDADTYVPLGSAIIRRHGDDCTIIAYGASALKALQAADELNDEGIGVEVIDLRTLYPFDTETILDSVRRTGKAVVVDEAPSFGSMASEVAALLQEQAFAELKGPVQRVCARRAPAPHSPALIEANLPQIMDIKHAVRSLISAAVPA